MIRAVRARRILPCDGFQGGIDDGCLVYSDESGRLLEVDRFSRLRKQLPCPCEDLGEVTLLPRLVMAHTHLELSHVRGRTTAGQGFAAWVRSLLQNPLQDCDPQALQSAVSMLRDSGVGFVADISSRNGLQVAAALAAAGIDYLLFLEIFGFGPATDTAEPPWPPGSGREILDNEPEHVAAAGHAPYSTSAPRLRAAKAWCEARGLPFSIHLAETAEEISLLCEGSGALAKLFRKKVLPKNFTPPGLSSVHYAQSLGLLNERTLAVHCVHVTDSEIRLLAEHRVSVCLCPRSNAHIGVGAPPLNAYREHGCSICLSTDGLSSCPDLNLWNELRYTRETLCPEVPLPETLLWITANPAKALGISDHYGSLLPGKRAAWTTLPEDLSNCL